MKEDLEEKTNEKRCVLCDGRGKIPVTQKYGDCTGDYEEVIGYKDCPNCNKESG